MRAIRPPRSTGIGAISEEAPAGAFVSEALGRKMLTVERRGDRVRAKSLARRVPAAVSQRHLLAASQLDSRRPVISKRRSARLAAVLLLGWGGGQVMAEPALGQPSGPPSGATVAVTRPPAGDEVLEEAAARIASELTAAGLSHRILDCPDPADCDDPASAARIWLSRADGIATIQVAAMLPSGLEARRIVRVPPATGGDDPAVLAVRAVELLRDIYLDVKRTPERREIGIATTRAPTAAQATARSPFTIRDGRLFLGYGALTGRYDLGPAMGPMFGIGIGLGKSLSILATLFGTFSQSLGAPELGRDLSSQQAMATIGVRYEVGTWRVRPHGTLATGVHIINVTDSQPGPTLLETDNSPSSLAPLLSLGAGSLGPHHELVACDGWLRRRTHGAVHEHPDRRNDCGPSGRPVAAGGRRADHGDSLR